MLNKLRYILNKNRENYEAEINKQQLEKMIKQGALLLDIRSPQEFNEGHLNGAIVIPYYDISKDVPSQIKSLKNKAKKGIKQYCDSKTRIGINYNLKNDSLVVNYVYSNSPANKSGDCILNVNKVMVTGQNLDLNAISKIFERGTNSTVSLEILRPSTGEVMAVDVTTGKVKVTDDDIDYVYKMHYENLIVPYWKDVRDDTTGRYGKAVLEYKQSKDKPAFLKEYNTRMINELYKHAINSSSNIK